MGHFVPPAIGHYPSNLRAARFRFATPILPLLYRMLTQTVCCVMRNGDLTALSTAREPPDPSPLPPVEARGGVVASWPRDCNPE